MSDKLSKDELNDVVKFYKNEIEGPTRKLIKLAEKIPVDGRGVMF